MNNIRAMLCGTALAFSMAVTTPAHADDAAIMAELRAMRAEINSLKGEVKRLKGEASSAQKSAIEAKAAASSAAGKIVKSDKDLKISLSPGPKIETADGETVFRLGGFAQVDAGNVFDDMNDYSSGATVRRARINVSGTIAKDWNYKLENDFASNGSVLTDVFVEYNGLKPVSITIGQFKEPFGLETLTSDTFTTFIERASPTLFSPDRNIGLQLSTKGDSSIGAYTAAIGGFGSGTGTASTDDEAKDIAARLTLAPIAEKDKVLHFGIAGVHRIPDATSDQMRFSSRPETQIVNSEFAVDTGNITGIDNVNLLGLEAAGVWGSASLQGEYVIADIDRKGSTASSTLGGYYAEASYFLTGESRAYKNGKFDRVSPKENFSLSKGGIGAWQVAARYSHLDLNDGPVTSGEMDNVTLALKWIPHPNVMFTLNYIMADTDSEAVVANDKPKALVLRSQFDF